MGDRKRVIALGFFDGIHMGHAALLERTVQRAREIGATPSVLSFDIHPDTLVFGKEVPLINSAAGRADLIRRLFGIENVIFIHFDRRVMQMPWQEFVQTLVQEMDAAWVVVGHDFRFGWKGEGTAQRLNEYCAENGLGCDIIPAVTLEGRIVSSTYIRELIRAKEEGYHALLAFVIQMDGVTEVRANVATHPAFGEALDDARKAGVEVLFLR